MGGKETSLQSVNRLALPSIDVLQTPRPVVKTSRRTGQNTARQNSNLSSPTFEISDRFWQRLSAAGSDSSVSRRQPTTAPAPESPQVTSRVHLPPIHQHASTSALPPITMLSSRINSQLRSQFMDTINSSRKPHVSCSPLDASSTSSNSNPVTILSDIVKQSKEHRTAVDSSKRRLQSLLDELEAETSDEPEFRMSIDDEPTPAPAPDLYQGGHLPTVMSSQQLSRSPKFDIRTTPRAASDLSQQSPATQPDPARAQEAQQLLESQRRERDMHNRHLLRKQIVNSQKAHSQVQQMASPRVEQSSKTDETDVNLAAVLETMTTHHLQLESLKPLLDMVGSGNSFVFKKISPHARHSSRACQSDRPEDALSSHSLQRFEHPQWTKPCHNIACDPCTRSVTPRTSSSFF